MTSVLVNNSDIDIHFYVVTDYVDDEYLESVERLTQMYGTTVTVLVFDNEAFRKLPSTKACLRDVLSLFCVRVFKS